MTAPLAALAPRPGRSCGSLSRDWSGRWCLQALPHVRMRLRRIFAKISMGEFDRIFLTDSLENCRELQWMLARFPMEMPPADRKHLRTRAQAHLAQEEEVRRIVDEGYIPPSFALALPPRAYQCAGAELVLRTGGALIADELGVGKTVTGICTFTDPRTLPALVVTLTTLPRQWEAELKKFAPHLRVHILKSGQAYDVIKAMRGRKRRGDETAMLPGLSAFPDVLISNYHKLSGWADSLHGSMKSVIFDEVQELRHVGSDKYRAAKHIADGAAFRTGLSATPIFNYGDEFHSVLDVLRPGELGSRDEFIREWCDRSMGNERYAIGDPKAFGTYLRTSGLMLRRSRRDVGREIPPLTRALHHIELDLDVFHNMAGNAAELARLVLAQGPLKKGDAMRAAEELSWKLRHATGVAKAPYAADFVKLLLEGGEKKVLLYGWHRDVYAIWEERLKDYKPVFFTGSESPNQKEAAKQAFMDPKSGCRVLIMSLRAGAGLDGLQSCCRTGVFGEIDWSPGVIDQCIGRYHRDGQEEPSLAYVLLADNGSDPVIADVLGLKKSQLLGVRDPDAALIERLDTGGQEHIRKLAAAYLAQRGLSTTAPAAPTEEAR